MWLAHEDTSVIVAMIMWQNYNSNTAEHNLMMTDVLNTLNLSQMHNNKSTNVPWTCGLSTLNIKQHDA